MLILLGRLLVFGVLAAFALFWLLRRSAGRPGGRRPRETCPSCQASIAVPDKEPGSCPVCGTLLARSPEGTLRIRVN
jgi:predicted amidophosphoribosyltransferase